MTPLQTEGDEPRDRGPLEAVSPRAEGLGSDGGAAGKVCFPDLSPIFVVGSPRSGTTLLRLMLNAHPRIAIAGEIHFFDLIVQIRTRIPTIGSNADLDRVLSLVRTTDNFRYLAGGEQALAGAGRRLRRTAARSYELLYRYLLEEFAASSNATRCGEKTPENVRYLPEIFALFPRSKVIHIVRDPRGAVASLIRMPWAPPDVVSNAVKWKADVRTTATLPNAWTDGYHEVRFCDLVKAPEARLREICDFVGEAYSPSMLRYYETAERHVAGEPWKKGAERPVDVRVIDRWRKELTEGQVACIEWLCGSELDRLGYERSAIPNRVRLMMPAAAALEVGRYLPYRLREWLRRRREKGVIRGSTGQAVRAAFRGVRTHSRGRARRPS